MENSTEETKRLENLEVRVAFQDQTIDELNQVIVSLREQMDELKAKVKNLSLQVSSEFVNKDRDIIPPHY